MRVALIITCLNDAMFPQTGQAVVRLLRRLGVDVDFPLAQTCCAQPMINTGYLDEAVPIVRNFVDAFAGYDAISTPPGSCARSARHQHALVACRSGDPALADAVAATSPKVHEHSEFLVDVLGVEDVGAYFPHKVTYHPTCHSLRMLGVGDRPRRLLRKVRGLRLVDLPGAEECCGFGGTTARASTCTWRLRRRPATRPAYQPRASKRSASAVSSREPTDTPPHPKLPCGTATCRSPPVPARPLCAPPQVLLQVGIRFRVPSESTIRLALGCLDGDALDHHRHPPTLR